MMTDGQFTVDRPETEVDRIPIPPFPRSTNPEGENHQARHQRVRSHDWMPSNAIRDNKRAQAHSDRCRMRIGKRLRTTPHGTERMDRRAEVINELAEEVPEKEEK